MIHELAENNLYIYPDTKYADFTNEFFTEPHCANTAVMNNKRNLINRLREILMVGVKYTVIILVLSRIVMCYGLMVLMKK